MDAIWKFNPTPSSTYTQNYFSLKFFAVRDIRKGEILTHSYILYSNCLFYRQENLSSIYYFKCDCEKCRRNLFNELPNTSVNNFP